MGEYSSVSHRRAWEVRVRKEERLTNPSDFDEISNRLWDAELCNLQDLWDTYNYLYVEDPERAQNLCKAGWGGFFWDLVRGWMGSEIILSISRLTDSPEMGKHRNLTLAALLDDPRLSGQLRCELRCELKHIQKLKLVKEVRERRNRVVAHSDERIALGEDALPILQLAKIEKIISRLQDVHRRHRGASMGSDVSHYGTHTLRGVKNLVKRLEQSERASLIFAQVNRSDEEKLRDWDEARRVFFPMGT